MGGDGGAGSVLSYEIVLPMNRPVRYSFPVCNMDCFTDSRKAAFLPSFPRYCFLCLFRGQKSFLYHSPATPFLRPCGWQRVAFDGLAPVRVRILSCIP